MHCMRRSANEREIQCSLSQEEGNLSDSRLILGNSFLKEITAASSERAGEPSAVQYPGFIYS